MKAEIFMLLLCFMKILAQKPLFGIDQRCVYNEAGNFGNFTTDRIKIDFYIPWKIADASRPTDSTLFVTSKLLNFSIPHPLSSSYQSIILKEYLKIGWNELYIEYVSELSYIREVRLLIQGIYKTVELRSNDLKEYKFWITGLHSFVNCYNDLKNIWIPAKTVATFPFVMSGYFDFIYVNDDQNSTPKLKFKEGLQICKENTRQYNVRPKCSDDRATTIQEKGRSTIYIYRNSFDDKDVFNYHGTYFTEVTFHNVGDGGFYIQMVIAWNKSAPLSSLQGNSKTWIIISICTIFIILLIAGLIYYCLRIKKPQQWKFQPLSTYRFPFCT